MVNDLQELLRRNVESPPPDHVDLGAVIGAGQRRVRRRRSMVGGVALAAAAVLTIAVIYRPGGFADAGAASTPPTPDAPTIQLSDATRAVEGRDYDLLASHTNQNLAWDNGQYFDGVTDDGLILFRDGPRQPDWRARYALMDPATGAKDWLPDPGVGQTQLWPVELGTDDLVLLSDNGSGRSRVAYLFDRDKDEWSTMSWPTLPGSVEPSGTMGPDGRLYLRVPATRGKVPEGGWPRGNGGEADDSNAEGDTYHVWSVSLSDRSDVRDEDLTVGDLAFTDDSMVWTDSTNGHAGQVHVRDLGTGQERSFDPHTGAKCNLLSFGATDDRVVMSQYCGDYPGGVRDDRVQILTTDGDQVVTIQQSGVEGYLAGRGGSDGVVAVSSYDDKAAGTYIYDLATDRFLRLSDAVSSYALGGSTPSGVFFWDTPVNGRKGATQWVGELRH